MLGTDVIMAQLARLIYGQFYDFLGPGCKPGLTRARFLPASYNEFYGGAHLAQTNAQVVCLLGLSIIVSPSLIWKARATVAPS